MRLPALAEPGSPMDPPASQTDPPLVHHAHHMPGKNLLDEVSLMNLYRPSDEKRDCISKRVLRRHLLNYCSQWQSRIQRHLLHPLPYRYAIVFSTCLYLDGVFVAVDDVLIPDTDRRFGHAHGSVAPASHRRAHTLPPRSAPEDYLWTGVHRVLPVPGCNTAHGNAPLRSRHYCHFQKRKQTRAYRPVTTGRTQSVRATSRSTALHAFVYTTKTVVGPEPEVSTASATAGAATRACFHTPVLPLRGRTHVHADATTHAPVPAHDPAGARPRIRCD